MLVDAGRGRESELGPVQPGEGLLGDKEHSELTGIPIRELSAFCEGREEWRLVLTPPKRCHRNGAVMLDLQ